MRPDEGGSGTLVGVLAVLAALMLLGVGGTAYFVLAGRAQRQQAEAVAARQASEDARERAVAAARDAGALVPPRRLDQPPAAGTVPAVLPWEEAGNYVGRTVTVEGRIVATYNSGRACFLDFAEDGRGKFHCVIFASAFPAFPEAPESHYRGKRLRVTGAVKSYRGAPEMVLESPAQVQVLD